MELEGFIFQVSTVHHGDCFFVANGLKGDVPVEENGYLVMVNECGDRVGMRTPGGVWKVDSKPIIRYNTNIPSYQNALKFQPPSLENV